MTIDLLGGVCVHPREAVNQALALVEIRLLDHPIIGDGCCVSLAEKGLI